MSGNEHCPHCHQNLVDQEHIDAPHPWRAEFLVGREWGRNALTFATEADANSYAFGLLMRWTMPSDYRIVPVENPHCNCPEVSPE